MHADVRDPAARPNQLRAELEGLRDTDRLDRDVGAEAVRELLDRARASSRPLLMTMSAPNSSALSSRASARSIATICPGVKQLRGHDRCQPDRPAPTIATVSPGSTRRSGRRTRTPSAGCRLGRAPARRTARPAPCTRTCRRTGLVRTRPAGRRSGGRTPSRLRRCRGRSAPPCRTGSGRTSVMHETRTRSPSTRVVTAAPTAVTVPTASWPRIVPGFTSGTSPLRMCRSVPQIVDESIRTIASVGSMIDGSGTSSQLRWPGPW